MLGMENRREDDLSALNQFGGYGDSESDTSSAEKSSQKRRDDREMERKAKQFILDQKKLDEDGEWSKQDQQKAEESFADKAYREAIEGTPATVAQIQDAVEGLYNTLESNLRLVPVGGDDNDVLTLDESKPGWEPGGLPTGTASGQIVYWNDTTKAWVKSATPATKSIPVWTGSAYQFVPIASAGFYLYNDGGNITGGIPKLI